VEGGEGTERCPGVLGVWEGELGVSPTVRVAWGDPTAMKAHAPVPLPLLPNIWSQDVCVAHQRSPPPHAAALCCLCPCPFHLASMPPTHHGMRRGARWEGPARVQRPAHPGCGSQQGMDVALVARLGAGGRLRGQGGVAVGEQAGRGQTAIRLRHTTAAAVVVAASGGVHEGLAGGGGCGERAGCQGLGGAAVLVRTVPEGSGCSRHSCCVPLGPGHADCR
jgi:hypothetical protein